MQVHTVSFTQLHIRGFDTAPPPSAPASNPPSPANYSVEICNVHPEPMIKHMATPRHRLSVQHARGTARAEETAHELALLTKQLVSVEAGRFL